MHVECLWRNSRLVNWKRLWSYCCGYKQIQRCAEIMVKIWWPQCSYWWNRRYFFSDFGFFLKGPDRLGHRLGRGHFARFMGFSDFSKGSPLWNEENKSCLNEIKFWEVSGNPKTSRFWKLQLSMSSGTQNASNIRHPYLRILFPFIQFLKMLKWS